jgi:hypothetical protein
LKLALISRLDLTPFILKRKLLEEEDIVEQKLFKRQCLQQDEMLWVREVEELYSNPWA